METQKFDFFFQKSLKFEFWLLTKSWNHLSFVNISPTLVIDTSMERFSRVLHHGNPEMWNFNEIEFCPYPEFLYAEKRNRPGFVNISPTLVIDMSMERSSRVLRHGNQKFDFFSRKFEIEFDLYFDLCWRVEIIHVGLNMHLHVDIGDASSSLWGSTSSSKLLESGVIFSKLLESGVVFFKIAGVGSRFFQNCWSRESFFQKCWSRESFFQKCWSRSRFKKKWGVGVDFLNLNNIWDGVGILKNLPTPQPWLGGVHWNVCLLLSNFLTH